MTGRTCYDGDVCVGLLDLDIFTNYACIMAEECDSYMCNNGLYDLNDLKRTIKSREAVTPSPLKFLPKHVTHFLPEFLRPPTQETTQQSFPELYSGQSTIRPKFLYLFFIKLIWN